MHPSKPTSRKGVPLTPSRGKWRNADKRFGAPCGKWPIDGDPRHIARASIKGRPQGLHIDRALHPALVRGSHLQRTPVTEIPVGRPPFSPHFSDALKQHHAEGAGRLRLGRDDAKSAVPVASRNP